jgi:hypothetical protein
VRRARDCGAARGWLSGYAHPLGTSTYLTLATADGVSDRGSRKRPHADGSKTTTDTGPERRVGVSVWPCFTHAKPASGIGRGGSISTCHMPIDARQTLRRELNGPDGCWGVPATGSSAPSDRKRPVEPTTLRAFPRLNPFCQGYFSSF